MAKSKSPSYPWYVGDAHSDERFKTMNWAEQGLYRYLLDLQWLEGSIPDDVKLLSILCRTSETEFSQLWSKIRPCFVKSRTGGRLINNKLDRLRKDRDQFLQRQSEAGKKSAESRNHRSTKTQPPLQPKSNHRSTKTQPPLQPKSNSSSSLSLSSRETGNRRKLVSKPKALSRIGSGGVGGGTGGEPESARQLADLKNLNSQVSGGEPEGKPSSKNGHHASATELTDRIAAKLARTKTYGDPEADEKAKREALEKVRRGEA